MTRAAKLAPLSRRMQPWLYLSPALLLWLGFFVFPLFFAGSLAFAEWNLISPAPTWVGLDNFEALFEDQAFWISLKNTLVFALATVIPGIAFSLGLALLLERSGKVKNFFRTALYLPVVASLAVTALIWMLMMSPNQGFINGFLKSLGIEGPNWLNDPSWAMAAIIIVSVWKALGYNMVLYIVGLKNIDKQLIEAAKVDGAGPSGLFWKITFPLLKPVHLFVLVVSLIHSFQLFTAVHIMTKGGPNNATNVLVYQIWQEAFQFFDIGRSSALSLVVFFLVLGISIVQIRITDKEGAHDNR